MCDYKRLAIGLAMAGLSVFGADPVRAQTAVDTSAAAVQPSGPVRRLSIDEAVALALEQNLDLQVERFNPQIQDFAISAARSGWTPNFQSQLLTRDSSSPNDTFLSGSIATLSQQSTTSSMGVGQLLPWGGGSYNLGWDSGRIETNNAAQNRNPQLNSTFFLNFTQPLLRNFRMDPTRQQIQLSEKNREIVDVQLQQSISVTTRNVRNAYYDLMFTIGNLRVQQQSLELAQRSLRENRARVEIGTMAPIDIVEAEAEVAQREENVIVAEASIARAEDRLRALVFDPANPDFWTVKLEPTETVTFQPIAVDSEAAVRNALAKRTDLTAIRKQVELSDVNVRFFKNQRLPDVNAVVNYSGLGRGGTILEDPDGPLQPLPSQIVARQSFGTVLGDAFGNAFPTWSLALQVNYPLGRSNAEANYARSRLQVSQVQKDVASTELQVATQVRDLARSVQTNGKRVEATRASRALSEKRLEAEEKKYQAGMTTPFLVFQAQRDLNQARNNELQALLDYARSVVDFETSQEAPLQTGGVAGSTSTLSNTSSGTTGTGTTGRQQRQ
ncbi:MAG: TolC family protein [Acidobacteria bacterium]|nr:TolC family protein [Acidobacteriota bacterium]